MFLFNRCYLLKLNKYIINIWYQRQIQIFFLESTHFFKQRYIVILKTATVELFSMILSKQWLLWYWRQSLWNYFLWEDYNLLSTKVNLSKCLWKHPNYIGLIMTVLHVCHSGLGGWKSELSAPYQITLPPEHMLSLPCVLFILLSSEWDMVLLTHHIL